MRNFWLGGLASATVFGMVGASSAPPTIVHIKEVHKVPNLQAPMFAKTNSDLVRIGAYSRQGHKQLNSAKAFDLYNQSQQRAFGSTLAPMSYMGLGTSGDKGALERISQFEKWAELASKGPANSKLMPILGLEAAPGLNNASLPKIFNKANPEFQALQASLERLDKKGIDVGIRFLSEANLLANPWSIAQENGTTNYKNAAKFFSENTPDNAKLIFSPSIGKGRTPLSMYESGVYDIIGGTIYARNPQKMYSSFYKTMQSVAPNLPYQIDELGTSTHDRAAAVNFVRNAKTNFPQLDNIMLFDAPMRSASNKKAGFLGFNIDGKSYLPTVIDETGKTVLDIGQPRVQQKAFNEVTKVTKIAVSNATEGGLGGFGIGFGSHLAFWGLKRRRRRKAGSSEAIAEAIEEATNPPTPANQIIPETKVENIIQETQPAPVQRAKKIRDEDAYQRRQSEIAARQHQADEVRARRARARAAHASVGRGQQEVQQSGLQHRLAIYKHQKISNNVSYSLLDDGEWFGNGGGRNLLVEAKRGDKVVAHLKGHQTQTGIHVELSQILDPEEYRKGHGKALYRTLIEHAKRENLNIYSDKTVSPEARRVYASLEREGFNIVENTGAGPKFQIQIVPPDPPIAPPPTANPIQNPIEEVVNKVSTPRQVVNGQQKIDVASVYARREAAKRARRKVRAGGYTEAEDIRKYRDGLIEDEVFKQQQIISRETKAKYLKRGRQLLDTEDHLLTMDEYLAKRVAQTKDFSLIENRQQISSDHRAIIFNASMQNTPTSKSVALEYPLLFPELLSEEEFNSAQVRSGASVDVSRDQAIEMAAKRRAKQVQTQVAEVTAAVEEAKVTATVAAKSVTEEAPVGVQKAAGEAAKDAVEKIASIEKTTLSKAGLVGTGAASLFALWAFSRNERRSQISPRRRDANVQVAPESFDTTNRRSIAMGAMAAGAALAGAPIKGISPQQRALLGIGGALGLAVGVGKATGEDTSSAVLGTAITGSIAAIAYSLLSKNGGKGVGVLRNFLTKHGPKAQLDAAALASQKAQNDIGGLTKYLSAQNIAIAGGLLTLPAAHSLMVKHFASEKRRTTDHSDVAFLPAWQDNKAGSTKWRKSNDPLFVSNPSNTASVNFNGAVYSHYNSSSIFENF